MTEDLVERLHRCIVEELRERGHEQGRPVKVAELYEDIVPYRAVRSRLDVELNADYEHALLRLLAGEGGLLRLEPEDVRQELEREVGEPYPSVGSFRKFPDSDVWVRLPTAGPADEQGPATGEESTVPVVVEAAPATVPVIVETTPATAAAPVPARCHFCLGPLPPTRDARFCPSCGRDQQLLPCPRCEELLDPEWRYCIRCGHGVAGA